MASFKHMAILISLITMAPCPAAFAQNNLYSGDSWVNLASDNRARDIGDVLTVVVFQSAEARNSAVNASRRRSNYQGFISGGALSEGGRLNLESDFRGQGDVSRSESFVTQFSVTIDDVLPNGDLLISGTQQMLVNKDDTLIQISGRIRSVDITPENQVLSTQIADAQIVYDGDSFAARNARPGLLQRFITWLGLGL